MDAQRAVLTSVTLRRETLADQVAAQLTQLIETQPLGPGVSLPSEAQLVERYGVSRPVVREALRSLEANGIIRVANGKGAVVMPLTPEPLARFFHRAVTSREHPLIELLEVRKGIEVQSAQLAAQRRTTDEITGMAALVSQMRDNLGRAEAYVAHDAQLHILIARASRNALLQHLVESIRKPLEETIRVGLHCRVDEDQRQRVQRLHDELVAAIGEGDPDASALAMARHFDDAVIAFLQGGRDDVGS